MDTRPHRLRRQAPSTVANKDQTYLAKITQQPYRHVQKVRSLLDEYEFKWSSIIKNTKTNENSQSLIRVNTFESDVLIGIYNQDQTFCFLAWNFVYLKFHKQFFNGLNKTQLSSSVTLSQFFTSIAFDQAEVSVFICFRNMRTIFFRHRFRNSKLHSSTKSIEIISVQMTHDIGPQIEILPKFNWKTMLFNGTLDDMFILDIVILNDLKNVAYVATIPAKIQQNLSQEFILSSNAWTINAQTEQIKIEGNIIKLSDEYAALGNENEHSLHLQNLWCHF
ncbi:unnamed protein product [Didymodactylos carnosus]|nr:unnamed protein product [Didymodactylos carnosus]CAF3622796.1 unnamed protein product [Didymodactylos carnosus]